MKRLFLQLTLANFLLLAIVTVWGLFLPAPSPWMKQFDVLVVLASLFCLTVHSIVYTYFIASGKFVQSAIEEHGYADRNALALNKSYKLKSFRYGFMAILVTAGAMMLHFLTAAPAADGGLWRGWAAVGAGLALLMNIHAARIEWKYVCANSVLSDEILKALGDRTGHAASAEPTGQGSLW